MQRLFVRFAVATALAIPIQTWAGTYCGQAEVFDPNTVLCGDGTGLRYSVSTEEIARLGMTAAEFDKRVGGKYICVDGTQKKGRGIVDIVNITGFTIKPGKRFKEEDCGNG
jgi:hypothetical protein